MQKSLAELPLLTDVLEPFYQTPEGLTLWKLQGSALTFDNLLESVFILSNDLADYFGIQHKNLRRNIRKIQKEGYLKHTLKIERMVEIGSGAQRTQSIEALTKHQTELLTVDFSGTRARKKKFKILTRLHAIETDVLRGAYNDARKKAREFDGVQLLDELGFSCSAGERLATKKDIAEFLKVPVSTVSSFLRKHKNEIQPLRLGREAIRQIGSQANRMNAYHLEDVLKIAFWMQSEVGGELKRRMLGNTSVLLQSETRREMEWRSLLAKVFAGFDLRYNFPIESYKVDFVIRDLLLALELDENHDSYNVSAEEQRERCISRHYTLIRFREDTPLEDLVNAILKAKFREVIKLYA